MVLREGYVEAGWWSEESACECRPEKKAYRIHKGSEVVEEDRRSMGKRLLTRSCIVRYGQHAQTGAPRHVSNAGRPIFVSFDTFTRQHSTTNRSNTKVG